VRHRLWIEAIGNSKLIATDCKEGEYLKGEMTLGLSDGIHTIPSNEMGRPLLRKWHVNAIQADITAYIAHPEKPNFFFRDEYPDSIQISLVHSRNQSSHLCSALSETL
jgi:hypothetical protein